RPVGFPALPNADVGNINICFTQEEPIGKVNGGRGTRRADVILCRHFVSHHFSQISRIRCPNRAATKPNPPSRALRRYREPTSERFAQQSRKLLRSRRATP